MEVIVVDKLRELINTQGQQILSDHNRFTSLMLDLCSGTNTREINILATALNERIPQHLRSSGNKSLTEELRANLSNRLEIDCALQADAANWAVDTWAEALGMVVGKYSKKKDTGKSLLKLQSPIHGDVWLKGLEYPIKWYFENLSGKIRIELLVEDKLDRVLTEIAELGSNNYGSFRRKVPPGCDTRNRYRIKLISTIDSSINDISDFFTICTEKGIRRFLLFQQKLCSWCSTFYEKQNLCPRDYKLDKGISCHHIKKLTVTERDEKLHDDQWWYKISYIVEREYGI